ncbi:MAG: twin-arginine translocase subunit TatC [Dehalobacterium sp.]
MSKDQPMTVVEHLNDLRKTLIVSITAWLVLTGVAFFVYQDLIFDFLTLPLREMDLKLVIMTPFEGFMAKFKAAGFAGLIFALPVILWQIWRFILPALKTKEKIYLLVIVPFSLLFFVCGVAFSYYYVLGVALKFLIITAGSGFIPMLGASKYLSFVTAMLLPFGLVFQLPLAALFLARIGLINHKTMSQKRKYAIVLIFVIAAVLTPTPDIVTQSIMALPMILLYEISIIVSWVFRKRKKSEQSM